MTGALFALLIPRHARASFSARARYYLIRRNEIPAERTRPSICPSFVRLRRWGRGRREATGCACLSGPLSPDERANEWTNERRNERTNERTGERATAIARWRRGEKRRRRDRQTERERERERERESEPAAAAVAPEERFVANESNCCRPSLGEACTREKRAFTPSCVRLDGMTEATRKGGQKKGKKSEKERQKCTDGWMYGRTNERAGGRRDRRTGGRTDGWTGDRSVVTRTRIWRARWKITERDKGDGRGRKFARLATACPPSDGRVAILRGHWKSSRMIVIRACRSRRRRRRRADDDDVEPLYDSPSRRSSPTVPIPTGREPRQRDADMSNAVRRGTRNNPDLAVSREEASSVDAGGAWSDAAETDERAGSVEARATGSHLGAETRAASRLRFVAGLFTCRPGRVTTASSRSRRGRARFSRRSLPSRLVPPSSVKGKREKTERMLCRVDVYVYRVQECLRLFFSSSPSLTLSLSLALSHARFFEPSGRIGTALRLRMRRATTITTRTTTLTTRTTTTRVVFPRSDLAMPSGRTLPEHGNPIDKSTQHDAGNRSTGYRRTGIRNHDHQLSRDNGVTFHTNQQKLPTWQRWRTRGGYTLRRTRGGERTAHCALSGGNTKHGTP